MLAYLLDAVTLAVACSVPLGLSSMLVALSFWGYPIKPIFKQIVFVVLLNVLLVDLLFFSIPVYLRLLDFIGFHLIVTLLFLRSLSLRKRAIVSLSAIVVTFIFETIAAVIKNHFLHDGTTMDSLGVLISFYWPTAGLMLLIPYSFAKFGIAPGRSILYFSQRKQDRNIPILLICFSVQIMLTMSSIGLRFLSDYGIWVVNVLLMLAVVFTLLSLILVLKVIAESRNEAVRMTQQYYIDDINRMFTTIRGQRHDFMNHVQVISSFIKMGKVTELERYAQELVGETTEINEIMSIGNPALAALVQSKSTAALEHRIHFIYECSGMDNLMLGLKSIDLIKVLGNLLDNAFDAAKLLPPSKRVVELVCQNGPTSLSITVRNSGSYIPEDMRRKLFEPGFSTKDGTHEGLGLSIVKERLDFYQGTIQVTSNPKEGTTIDVSIPHKRLASSK